MDGPIITTIMGLTAGDTAALRLFIRSASTGLGVSGTSISLSSPYSTTLRFLETRMVYIEPSRFRKTSTGT
jgi:hypothetical protein